MFNKILIANRGEIACRIISTAKRMDVQCVAVYSEADKNALHVQMADQAFHIGKAAVSESYLRIDKIIEVARISGCEAIHPGYGFLSENPGFVEACESAGIVFIGPRAEAIRAMGLKDAAKALMQQSNVPVVPGYHGANQDSGFLQSQANECGYPVLIKARAGGGGKGMRLVNSSDEFSGELDSARREALSSFGDDHVIIEKFISSPRHIEVQVFADSHGNAVHLFERDCSMQRRHQKVIEEAPAPGMTPSLRESMGEAAVRAAKAVDYLGAGTVEFIVDSSNGLKPDGFYFMEMNTRLQVEHPVTESISGQDLVEWQLRVAAGESLPKTQQQLAINGCALEARIYAEDPQNNFMPSIGRLEHLSFPDGQVRIDSGVRRGDVISPYYDPMIAKVIVHAANRDSAVSRLRSALMKTQVVGCVTNVDFLTRLLQHGDFCSGQIDTGLIERNYDLLTQHRTPDDHAIALAALAAFGYLSEQQGNDPWTSLTGWRHFSAAKQYTHLSWSGTKIAVQLIAHAHGDLEISFDEKTVSVILLSVQGNQVSSDFSGQIIRSTIVKNNARVSVFNDASQSVFYLMDDISDSESPEFSDRNIISPMPGLVTSVNVQKGQGVKKGDVLIVMEAMKMEHSMRASMDGFIDTLMVSAGDQVQEGVLLLSIGESEINESTNGESNNEPG